MNGDPLKWSAQDVKGQLVLIGLISVLGFALFISNTSSMPLWDPDEGRYAEVPREMIQSHDWLRPTLFGVPYLEKPPLFYWLTATSFRLFGLGEWQARVVPAVAAALGLLATGLFASRVFNLRVGMMSCIVLATSALYFGVARVVVTDTLFGVLIGCALMAFYLAHHSHVSARWGFTGFWFFAAAATLTKGPAGPIICVLTILMYLAPPYLSACFERIRQISCDLLRLVRTHGKSRSWVVSLILWVRFSLLVIVHCVVEQARMVVDLLNHSRQLWPGAILFLMLTLPWFIYTEKHFPGYLHFYIVKEHLQRASGSEHPHPPSYFIPVLLLGSFPWTFCLFGAIPFYWTRFKKPHAQRSALQFLLVWSVVVYTLFSIASGKLIPYILPMFPALAILIAYFLDGSLANALTERRRMQVALSLTPVLFFLAIAALHIASHKFRVRLSMFHWIATDAPLIVGTVIVLLWSLFRPTWVPAAIAACCALYYFGLGTIGGQIGEVFSTRPHVRLVQKLLRQDEEVALVDVYLPSVAFYLRRIPYFVGAKGELMYGSSFMPTAPRLLTDIGELKTIMRRTRVFCITRTKSDEDLQLRKELAGLIPLSRNQKAALLVSLSPSQFVKNEHGRSSTAAAHSSMVRIR